MIGMRPYDVIEEDQDRVWARLYGKNLHRPTMSSVVGKIVRIGKIEGLFDKGYMPNWREEHFHIKSRVPKRKPVFKLANDLGDNIKGQFN